MEAIAEESSKQRDLAQDRGANPHLVSALPVSNVQYAVQPPHARPSYSEWPPYSSSPFENQANPEQRPVPPQTHAASRSPRRGSVPRTVPEGSVPGTTSLPAPPTTSVGLPPYPAPIFQPWDERVRNGMPMEDPARSLPPGAGPPPPPHVIPGPPGMPHGPYPGGSAVPVGGMPYDPSSYLLSQAMSLRQPRRTTRAQQACEQCRSRKAKCDEGRPSCSHCKENNVQCVYKDAPPHKLERSTQLILDRLQNVQEQLAAVLGGKKANGVESKKVNGDTESEDKQDLGLGQLAETLSTDLTDKLLSRLDEFLNEKKSQSQPPTNTTNITNANATQPQVTTPAANPANGAEHYLQRTNMEATNDSVMSDDKQPSIPFEHTTAAHKLLMWPTIQKIVGPDVRQDYVMELEEARGPLRPYGRGEGDPSSLGQYHYFNVTNGSMAGSPVSWENDHFFQNPSASRPFSSGYGDSFGLGSPVIRDEPVPDPMRLKDLCRLNVHDTVVRRHHHSYMANMHILHPILEENSLRRLVDDFVHNYSLNARGPLAGKPRGLSATNQGRTTKRKRSLEDDGDGQCQSGERTAHSTIHRSIENAIVLLVLALGAICTWKDDLPGFVQDGFNPLQSSPLSPSRKLQRRSQAESPRSHTLRMMPKNVDNIPGMAYYAFASDILGSHEGRTDLPFAQACILAGLYAGQVAHPFTSHAWLSKASRACQMLVRSSNYPLLPDESLHKHLISFAFWTCQQLESDILAELDLPHSGLSRYENIVKFPDPLMVHSISEDTDSTGGQILVLYLTQIVLRNVLNGTHTHLYKADGGNDGVNMPYNKVMTLIRFQKTLSMNLESWRNMLPAELKWNDGDPPSDDINIARMRAKYYGARYIIHRPLLHYALHSFQPGSSNSSALASPASVASTIHGASPKTTVPLAIRGKPTDEPAAKYRTASFGGADIDPSYYERQTMDACRICIESAIHSTTAFDGLVGRPIVTNIFGTAHAQFGNMLVLSAVYNSPLRQLVDRNTLLSLFDRTIKFLAQNRYISPSLRKDAEILSAIRSKIFEQPSPPS